MGSRQYISSATAWGRQRISAAGLVAFVIAFLSGALTAAVIHAARMLPAPKPHSTVLVAVITQPEQEPEPEPDTSAALPSPPIPAARDPSEATFVNSIDRLTGLLSDLDYRVEAISEQGDPVPRLYLARLPGDFDRLRSVDQRRNVLIKALLPLILRINETILADRRNLIRLYEQIAGGMNVAADDRDWLVRLARRYDANPSDPVGLLSRVDAVPPSLALAQAGEESGWGASRSARLGNAMFGQATWDGTGPPIGEPVNGRVPRLRIFERLSEGTEAYVRNLNTNRAYESFRTVRAAERRAGRPLDGSRLAAGLMRYSERGQAYIDTIRAHIRANRLHRLDEARLHERLG